MRRAITIAGAAFVVALYACVGANSERNGPGGAEQSSGDPTGSTSGGATGGGNFDKAELAKNLGEQMIDTYAAFAEAADALSAAAGAYAASLGSEERDAVRQAWRDAMAIWQRAEVMQVGPTGPMGTVLGGEDWRDNIYSWPLVNRCRVDQELTEGRYVDVTAFESELINVRGLDALEYLLFHEGTGNACPSSAAINTNGSWNAITGQLPQRRADYAKTVAIILAKHAAALRDRWSPVDGNFLEELYAPEGVYTDVHHALNAVTDAMFYLDLKTKDAKLAVPAGLSDCAGDVCPDLLESTYAGFSKQEIVGNLEGFQILFLGGPPTKTVALGFDDWLIAIGRAEIAEHMADMIHAAMESAAAIEEDDLADALASDPDSVRDLYFAVKKVTDSLKSEFVTTLDLNVPKSAEGDTD